MSKVFNVLITDDQPNSWQAIHDLLNDVFVKLNRKWKPFPSEFVDSPNLGDFFIREIERRADSIAKLNPEVSLPEEDAPFDLAIIDINLGKGTANGLDLIDKLRELSMCNGIVIISGFTHDPQLSMVVTNPKKCIKLEATPEVIFKTLFPDRYLLCRKDRNLTLSLPYVNEIKKQLLENEKVLEISEPRISLVIDNDAKTANLMIAGVSNPIPVDYDFYSLLATAKRNKSWWVSGDDILEIYQRQPRQPRKNTKSRENTSDKGERSPQELAINHYKRQLRTSLEEYEHLIFDVDYCLGCILPRIKQGNCRLAHGVEVEIKG